MDIPTLWTVPQCSRMFARSSRENWRPSSEGYPKWATRPISTGSCDNLTVTASRCYYQARIAMVDSKPPLVKIPAPNDIRTGLYYSISSTHDPTPKLWDVATSGWHHSGFGSEGGIKLWDVRTGKLLRA